MQRAREVGVRLALGAMRVDVLRLILSQTAMLATQLFEISSRDPITFAATALLLAAVALLAGWVPAHRATTIEPAITLRAD